MKKAILLNVFILLISSIFINSCGSDNFISKEELFKNLKIKDYPDKKDYPASDCVFLLDKESRIYSSAGIITHYHIVKKVLDNYRLYDSWSYECDYSKELLDFEAKITKPDGKFIYLIQQDLNIRKSKELSSEYQSKAYYVSLPGVVDNSIIEIKYSIIDKEPYSNSWLYIGNIIYPTLYQSFSVQFPKALYDVNSDDFTKNSKNQKTAGPIVWREKNFYNVQTAEPIVKENEKDYLVIWSYSDIPKIEFEDNMPNTNIFPQLQFYFASEPKWDTYVNYMWNEFFKDRLYVSDSLKNTANRLTKGLVNEKEKIQALSAFVSEMRYEAVALGKSGFQPNRSEAVCGRMYGDCKDKSFLLVNLLRSIGVKASPVLVLTADYGEVDFEYPNSIFNHAIVLVETSNKEQIFIDPTINFAKLGEIHKGDEGVNVIVFDENGKGIQMTTPKSKAEDNILKYTVNIKELDNNKFRYDVVMSAYGEFDFEYRNHFYSSNKTDIENALLSFVKNKYFETSIKDFTMSDFKNVDSPFEIKFSFETDKLLSKQGKLSIANYDVFYNFLQDKWTSSKYRVYDVAYDYKKTIQKEINFDFKNDIYSVSSLPKNTEVKDKYFDFKRECKEDSPGKISIIQTTVIKETKIPVKEFEVAKSNLNKIKDLIQEKVILKKTEQQ